MSEHGAHRLHVRSGGQRQRSSGVPQKVRVEPHSDPVAQQRERAPGLSLAPHTVCARPEVWSERGFGGDGGQAFGGERRHDYRAGSLTLSDDRGEHSSAAVGAHG